MSTTTYWDSGATVTYRWDSGTSGLLQGGQENYIRFEKPQWAVEEKILRPEDVDQATFVRLVLAFAQWIAHSARVGRLYNVGLDAGYRDGLAESKLLKAFEGIAFIQRVVAQERYEGWLEEQRQSCAEQCKQEQLIHDDQMFTLMSKTCPDFIRASLFAAAKIAQWAREGVEHENERFAMLELGDA